MKQTQLTCITILMISSMWAQQNTIPVKDNLVVQNIPPLSANYITDVKNYTEARSASIVDWHPLKKEMLILTRFANSTQLHYVKMPGGDRQQITFYDEQIGSATFQPTEGKYFLFTKDVGGNEFSQIYRYDVADKKITLLTDGKKSQNGSIKWNNKGDMIAYASTKRNGEDRDFYLMDPLHPENEKLIIENKGGGWGIVDFSPNDQQLLINEVVSVNESNLYILDIATLKRQTIYPGEGKNTNAGICYNKDGTGIYFLTNRNSIFNQLSYYDVKVGRLDRYIATTPAGDVEAAKLSKDGKIMAFIVNENGISKLYLLTTSDYRHNLVPNIPVGVITNLYFTNDSKSLAFVLNSYNQPSDVYEYVLESKKLIRWTESEVGGQDISLLREPQLISWKSFDGKTISGYYYQAAAKFTGKRPVVISIHGGPEGQSRPIFQGRMNYLLNEMGISLLFPNVRGSSGYGKTFLDADNGFKREESVKDIGALIDWIGTQPDLDKERIMITGGSYGGYMSLAVSYMYSDKIRCAIDVVGISSFKTFLNNTEAYRRDLRRVEYGDERDSAMAKHFDKISPLNHTDEIKKPLFIVQGEQDPRVPYTEAVQMKDKIKAKGGEVWFLMAKDEGHGFRKKDNQDFQFYAMLEFIKTYLIN
jgi:dipeptidyl aminopeptidase/acylaminoacyl peptidase